VTLPYVAAAAAAVCYGVASVLQAMGARRTSRGALQLGLLVRLARELPYVAGLALDLAGFVLSVVALRSLPLFLVQSVVAANVGVTAVAAMLLLKARLRPLEILALLMLVSGLMLLALSAKAGDAHPLPEWAQWVLLSLLPVLIACAVASARRTTRASAITLAAVAGAGFGAVGIAARAVGATRPWWHAVSAPAGWAILGFGALAVVAFAAALQRGSVTVVAAVVAGIETVIPSVIGFAALGDATRAGFGPPVTAAGFALALAGVFLLTPYADIERSPIYKQS
jgi:drug/metabolite transporter (DMT)-like permease